MFLCRKNQYLENKYTAKGNLQIHAMPIKLPMAFFTELEQKKWTVHMETQKTPNSQSSVEKEEWNWRNQPTQLQWY